MQDLNLKTVCQEARCPNISECYCQKTATFLILGDVCTRGCSFCAVKKGNPLPVDLEEPVRIAQAISKLGLRYAVITSVTRDDLIDGGAGAFVQTISVIRKQIRAIKIEVLIPDFQGSIEPLKKVIDAKPDVISHNLETVPRLYNQLRQGADYNRSLMLLQLVKNYGNIYTKSGLMLGLGETSQEVLEVLRDLRNKQCDFLTLGQYLSPSKNHYPVKEYITPEQFAYYKEKALEMGFSNVASSPYARSSYLAGDSYCADSD